MVLSLNCKSIFYLRIVGTCVKYYNRAVYQIESANATAGFKSTSK